MNKLPQEAAPLTWDFSKDGPDVIDRLNIGSGGVKIPGFTNVDRKLGDEAFPLTIQGNLVPSESIEEIRASHILEHFSQAEVARVLQDWVRVLKPGGIIRIAVPDFNRCAQRSTIDPLWAAYIMGGQTDEDDYHKAIFTRDTLIEMMEAAGLSSIREWFDDSVKDCSQLPISLNLEGVKGQTKESQPIGDRLCAVMSVPRTGFTDMFLCAQKAFVQRGIEFRPVAGMYFGQNLERQMQLVCQDGFEFVMTLDYDSVFTGADVDQMVRLMDAFPEADAIAPLQMKRENDDRPFIWDVDANGNVRTEWPLDDFYKPIQRILHAHFGLTIFRTEKLKAMPHPWFYGQPNDEGEWTEGRMDDDIYFWEKWKRMKHTLYLANRVAIGHCQMVVTWPDKHVRAYHQYMTDWNANGKPPEAWH